MKDLIKAGILLLDFTVVCPSAAVPRWLKKTFQITSPVNNAKNDHFLILEAVEHKMFWETGHRHPSGACHSMALKEHGEPAAGFPARRRRIELTAFSHLSASFSPDCS
jgi:hypothetical protein